MKLLLILLITPLLTLTSCGLDPMWVDPPECMIDD